MKTIATLITCHNRKFKTVACLEKLFAQTLPENCQVKAFLVDDGCTDGTAAAVASAFPAVQIIAGSGDLFWCRGMRLAWEHAAREAPDFYLWLNDDTMLLDGALHGLLTAWQNAGCRDAIFIGSCQDPMTRHHTYGGERKLGSHPGKMVPVVPDSASSSHCDSFNGNCVLVTKGVFEALGPMDDFAHAMADTDYGLRATSMAVPVLVAPGYLATCEGNPAKDSWSDQALPRIQRLRSMMGRKGLPPGDWWRFLWKHAAWRALLYWPATYVHMLIRS